MNERRAARVQTRESRRQRATRAVGHVGVIVLGCVILAACGGPSPPPSASANDGQPSGDPSTSTPSSVPMPSVSPPVPGGPSLPSVGVGESSACGLLSADQLAAIFETANVVTRPMPATGWVSSQCAWNAPSGGFFVGIGDQASIEAMGDPTVTDAAALLEKFKSQAPGGTLEAVDEVGDGAAATEGAAAAIKGDKYIQVTSVGMNQSRLIEILGLIVDQV